MKTINRSTWKLIALTTAVSAIFLISWYVQKHPIDMGAL